MKPLSYIETCIIILMVCCAFGTAWNSDEGIVSEWSFGSDFRPYDVAILSDGSAWFTHEDSEGRVGSVFTLNLSEGTPVVFSAPFEAHFHTIASAPDDTLWITDADDDRNDRIVHFQPYDLTGNYFDAYPLPDDFLGSEADYPLGAYPYGVSVAPDGMIWFTCWYNPSIGSLDPATGSFSYYPLPWEDFDEDGDLDFPGSPGEIAFRDDGTIWFTINDLFGGQAGCGELTPDNREFVLFNDPSLFFPDHCCPVPPTMKLRTPWGIIFDRMSNGEPDYYHLWFTDKTGNYLIMIELIPPPLILRYETPVPEIRDTHFIAVDPDGIIWLASWAGNRIGTYDDFSREFSSFPLESQTKPMGIAVSPIGEVWWAASGEVSGTGRGAGRFIPFIDSDDDGIDDAIDSDPASPSDEFSDSVTTGILTERGDQILNVTDATYPHGIRIMVSCGGGEEPAQVSVCAPLTMHIVLSPCDDILVTCGSATLQVFVGPVEIDMGNGLFITAPSGTEVSVAEISENLFIIENRGHPGSDVVFVTQGEWMQAISPGESRSVGIPIADAGPDQGVLVGRPCTFDGSGSYDPDGTLVSWEWDFDDGGTGTGEKYDYTYLAAGVMTVTLTVTDDEGLISTDTAIVRVQTPVEGLQDIIMKVKSLGLPSGIERGLHTKLYASIDSLQRGKEKTATNQLGAFINQVKAQRGKTLTGEQADNLIHAVQDVIASISAS